MNRMTSSRKRQTPTDPIPSAADIDRVREVIGSNTRDLLLFNLALETGVTANQDRALPFVVGVAFPAVPE